MSTANRSSGRNVSSGRSTSSAGRSRAGAAGRQTGAGRQSTGRSSSYSSSYRSRSGRNRRRRKPEPDYRLIAAIGVILILIIAAAVFGLSQEKRQAVDASAESGTEPSAEVQMERNVMVEDVSLTGLSRTEALQKLQETYAWGMTVVCDGETYEVPDLMSGRIEGLLDQIYQETEAETAGTDAEGASGDSQEIYSLDTSGMEEEVDIQVQVLQDRWNTAAKNGSISGYDASSDTFTFSEGTPGREVNGDKLKEDMLAALENRDFDAEISAELLQTEPEITAAQAKEQYRTISTFTTTTTANSKRNTNIRLSCEALNGAIVQPGQELSFNDTVGERTETKGYQGAAAYNNGEVVQEIGGGVCQTSTTLYNAVVRAGLKITVRRSHTFEPSYITPGQDATVSWGGPDFKFLNNSSTAIGIRAHYANQKVTVSVYGIPILEEGVTYDLKSEKLEDLDLPAPTYEEDQTLQPGVEVTSSAGTRGSRWQTRLIIKKDGEIVSQEVDHSTTYKGHAPVIRRNTSGIVIGGGTSSSVDPSASSASSDASSLGVPEGTETTAATPTSGTVTGPGSSGGLGVETTAQTTSAPIGPGETTQPAGPGAAQPSETPAPTAAAPSGGPSSAAGDQGQLVAPKPE